MRRLLLFALLAGAGLAQAPKPVWEQSVTEFYRAAALQSALEVQLIRAQLAAQQALAKLREACDGSVQGIERLQVVCEKNK